jgi:hypothetical protein
MVMTASESHRKLSLKGALGARAGASALLLVSLGLAGCGGDDPPASANTTTGALLPFAVGNSWTYNVTQDGESSNKTTTVMDAEPVGGTGPYAATKAFKVVTMKGTDAKDKTESWQGPRGGDTHVVVRYRELSYGAMTGMLQLEEFWDPPRIHADGSDAHTMSNVMYVDAYKETKIPAGMAAMDPTSEADQWRVLDADASVDVPAGHFDHVIHLQKTGGSDNSKEYWYLRGVGKLKESGSQTELLVSYTVADKEGTKP